jgi:hypothetical protein
MSIFDQLIDITGIDFSTGQRGVQPMKEAIEKSKVRKIKDLSEVADVYGGLDKLPSNLKPIENITTQGGITRIDPKFNIKGVGKDEELRLLPGSDKFGREGKYYVSKKDAPRLGGFADVAGGLIDAIPFLNTDLDRKGSDFGAKPEIIDINDPSNYLVSQAQQSQVKGALEDAGVGSSTSSAIPDAEEKLDFLEKNADRINKLYRDRARGAAFDEALNYAITQPIRNRFLKDASTFKQRQLLEAERIKQAMPNAIQNRLLAADAGFATQAGAIAGQQDSATRFADLGNQRQFGQNVVYTPPLLRA